MILEQLTLNNFRVFQGEHKFDLTPRVKYGKKRPIILYGGLNGAGKTTTLTAVRLALYGKQSIGFGSSQKDYNNFLEKSIHRSTSSVTQASSACIQLSFSYANMGIIKHYTVKRHWMLNGKKVIEKLSIAEDGKELLELNAEQCQGFLNELIPIGVSDLFFFDSEKIAELAEDTGGFALGDAIKKLLGLDLIDTLNADLSVLLRSEYKKNITLETQKEITKLEKKLFSQESKAEKETLAYENARINVSESDVILEKLENELTSRGGAWAISREKELKNQISLSTEKDNLQKRIREILESSYPLSLAKTFVKKTLKQLNSEKNHKKNINSADAINKHLVSLEKNIKKILSNSEFKKINKIIDKEFKQISRPNSNTNIIHDISDSLLDSIEITVDDATNNQKKNILKLGKELQSINNKLDMAGKNIARAPEELLIKPLIDKVKKEQDKRADALAKQRTYTEIRKRHLRDAIETVRTLDNLSSKFTAADTNNRTLEYISNSKNLLSEFAAEMAKNKIKDLEHEFINSFHKLARKEDISLRAEINPKDFSVKLIDDNDIEIDKDELSAGEKQIYAISILEALARTSGRKLPIIIDTPLARLDSIHRTKLIKNYFPYASHQVIILSTDTEVDEEFYEDLSSSISHAYKLNYDSKKKCTSAKEGYFWKHNKNESIK